MEIAPFQIQIPQGVIADLRQRLARTRWPDAIPGSGWEYGADRDYIKELANYWLTQFDWRKQESALNQFHHFKANVDGFGIHCIHERGKAPQPLPLVITHGWPGSFVEMVKLIPLLADPAAHGGDPADAFDVVAPSMPGYGFSDRPSQRGMNVFRFAEMWVKLMAGLGYLRFGAHGGDFGAGVSTALGLYHADHIIGLHLNYIPGSYRPFLEKGHAELSKREKQFLKDDEKWWDEEGGYCHVQLTHPQSISFGLNDSPVGLAAWIVEKFRAWGDCGGDVERRFSKDELLTNVMIYWATETISSANRLYFEARLRPMHFQKGQRVAAPCGVAHFPKEAPFPPRQWVERGYNIQRWSDFPRGGHFPALEEPELLAEDIRAFFRPLRNK
jgi:pimeloyl-ACP methyl ester carboxylesterase